MFWRQQVWEILFLGHFYWHALYKHWHNRLIKRCMLFWFCVGTFLRPRYWLRLLYKYECNTVVIVWEQRYYIKRNEINPNYIQPMIRSFCSEYLRRRTRLDVILFMISWNYPINITHLLSINFTCTVFILLQI